MTGLSFKIPQFKQIVANPIFTYKADQKSVVDAHIATLMAKYPRIVMERFDGTAKIPSSFAPTGICGITHGYVTTTLKNIGNKLNRELEAEMEAQEVRKKKKLRSKSPPTALRREVATSISAGRRSSSK